MLGKLLKHEWRGTYKVCLGLNFIMLVITLAGGISFRAPMWQGYNGGQFSALDITSVLMIMLYVVAVIGIMWGILIYLGIYFYRSMYSDQGYLTHTLPVNPHLIMISKILISSFWYIFTMLVLGVSIMLFMGLIISSAGYEGGVWRFLMDYKEEILRNFELAVGVRADRYLAFSVTMGVAGAFTGVVTLFGAITLGQLFSRHRVIMSLVSYFVINFIIQIVAGIAILPFALQEARNIVLGKMGPYMVSAYPASLLVSMLVAAAMYFCSIYIIKRRLNLY